jgi:hypothetical protein
LETHELERMFPDDPTKMVGRWLLPSPKEDIQGLREMWRRHLSTLSW